VTASRPGCVVSVRGIKVFAHHGVLPGEREQGQEFVIDVALELAAPVADDLAETVDYARVASMAADLATSETFDLIETVAARIAEAVLEDGRVRKASVTVSKPGAPMPVPVENVSVTVTMEAEGR